jgi:2-haloacid dehalogenase
VDFDRFRVLTFDCYGTLIDWESGILAALGPLRSLSPRDLSDEELLELYARIESRLQAGEYRRYSVVLESVTREMARQLEVPDGKYDPAALSESIAEWRPFPDTIDALRRLKKRFELAIVSNIDDDLFVYSARRLEVDFDYVITAEQVGSYKPSHGNFTAALDKIGRDKSEILHVAQSLFHDIKPAREMGIASVWVNRRKGRRGAGATYPAEATPDLEVPDLISLARLIEGESGT